MQGIYAEGGDPSIMMTVPALCRKFNEYLFTSSARIAALQKDVGDGAATAVGSVKVFMGDFNDIEFVPNRLQMAFEAAYATPSLTAAFADVFILDPSYLELSYLKGYRSDALGKTGLSDKSVLSVDWTLKVLNENSQGMIASVSTTADCVA